MSTDSDVSADRDAVPRATPAPDAARAAELRRLLLERRLRGQGGGRGRPAIPPQPRGGPLPLSPGQRRQWLLDQLMPGGAAYIVPMVLRLTGPLRVPALGVALDLLAARHEILRTRYVVVDGEPRQVVDAPLARPLPLREVAEVDLAATVREALARGFDLARGPVWRAELLRVADTDHVLVVALHHIACDGWSLEILADELAEAYTAFAGARSPRLAPAPVQYADFAAWQWQRLADDDAAGGATLAFWRERLAELVPTELPTDRARPPVPVTAAGRVEFTVPAPVARAALVVGHGRNATPFMTLLAAFYAVLARHSGQADLAVGTPVAGRSRPDLERAVGFFVNTLVLRCDLAGNPTVGELLDRVRATALDAFDHQDAPFERLVEVLQPARDLSRNPLVQIMFLVEDVGAVPARPAADLVIGEVPVPSPGVKVDLTLGLRELADGGYAGVVEYAAVLFEEATVRRLAEAYVRLLGAAADPAVRLADLPVLSADERRSVLERWNDTAAPVPAATLAELVDGQVRAAPDAVAVLSAEARLSYAELAARADRLAGRLRALGAGPDRIVGVCLPRGADLVVAVLAALKAGAAYLPLDPDDPDDRLRHLLRESDAVAVLTDAGIHPRLSAVGPPAVCVADGPADPAPTPTRCDPDNLAYVIYTSGSTGRPKGVLCTHRGIVNRLAWMQERYRLAPGDRVLHKTPYTFDVSVWELFWPLVQGATVVVAPPGWHRDPAALAELSAAHKVTHVHFVPSMLDAFLDAQVGCPDSWREVFCSGEALRPATAARLLDRSRARVHNLYGPTEASIDVTAYEVTRSTAGTGRPSVPIGAPIDNTRIYVLDAELQPAPVGATGEIYLGGVGLARGYLDQPSRTAERFVPDPFGCSPGARLYRTGDRGRWRPDGVVEFLGRLDRQVKLRGFRIELGEVEAALAAEPTVAGAVAGVVRTGDADPQLVAWVVPRDAELDLPALRASFAHRLPAHLMPAQFVRLAALPTTPSGKVDAARLPPPDGGRAAAVAYAPPRTPVEDVIAQVWAEALGVDRVGRDDGFFVLGGDSMRAIRAVAELRSRGLGVSVPDIFAHQTVAALAAAIGGSVDDPEDRRVGPFELIGAADRARLPAEVTDAYPLSELQAGMVYELLDNDAVRPYHNVTAYLIRDEGEFSAAALREAARRSAARHEVLRTSFDLTRYAEPMQLVHASAEPDVGVHDLRRLPEGERRRAVERAVREERGRPFRLTEAPLWRLRVQRTGERNWWLLLVECHAIMDGWSHNSLLAELLADYRAIRAGAAGPLAPPPAVRFADFVAAEREGVRAEAHRRFWLDRLSDHERFALPAQWGDDEPDAAVTTVAAPVGHLEEPLRLLAARAGAPLKSVFLAAHVRVLAALTHQSRFFTGLVCNGRPERLGGDEVRGMFLNTVPLATQPLPSSWRLLVERVFAEERRLWPHRRYPLPALQRAVRADGPLIEVTFNYVDFYRLDRRSVDLEETLDASPNEFPVAVTATPATLLLTVHRRVVGAERLADLARLYLASLEAMAADPESDPTDSAPLVTATPWSRGARVPVPERTLPELVAGWTRATPTAVAVVDDAAGLTYAELSRRAGGLAGRLRGLGVAPETVVGVCLPRGVDLAVALLGVLGAGAAFLPLVPDLPVERMRWMLADAGVDVLVTSGALVRAGLATPRLVVAVDGVPPADGAPAPRPCLPDNLAYVTYTSGSTGRPKAVMVSHRSLLNCLLWSVRRQGLAPGDRVLQRTPVTFDPSNWELFAPLVSGATVVMGPPGAEGDPRAISTSMARHGVTLIKIVPSLLRALVDEPDFAECRSLRWVIPGAEPLSEELCRRLTERLPVRVDHTYGPTECTIKCTAATWSAGPGGRVPIGRVPIGRPIDNTRVYVLDRYLRPVPVGVAGELYVGGAGVARGYLGQPALTADRFVPDPLGEGERVYRTSDLVRWRPDGQLQFIGRADRQVKVNAVRVEPAEVEAALMRQPGVREALVTANSGRLVAYLVRDGGAYLDPGRLREALREILPGALVPTAFVPLAALPLRLNGKVDHDRLPPPELAASRPFTPPRTPIEHVVAEVWREVLDVDRVGVEDDFYELGGHSLAAMLIVGRLRARHGIEVSPRDVQRHASVAALAASVVERNRWGPDGPVAGRPSVGHAGSEVVVWLRRGETGAPVFCVHPGGGSVHWYWDLAAHLPGDHPVAGFRHPALADGTEADRDLASLAGLYVERLRSVQPRGPYRLFAWCGGASVGWEMACALDAAGDEVTLCLLDPALELGPDGGPRHLPLLRRCEAAFDELHEAPDPARVAELRREISDLLRIVVNDPDAQGLLANEPDDGWLEVVRSWRRQLEQRLAYRFRPYPGRVHLFVGDEMVVGEHESRRGRSYEDYLSHWRVLARGGLVLRRVGGDHLGALRAPHVIDLARLLAEAYDGPTRPGGRVGT